LSFLRFVAWLVLLIIVTSIAYALFAARQYVAPQLLHAPQSLWSIPSFEHGPSCSNSVYMDPWRVVNYYGLSVENNEIVYKYTNTSEEAEKALNDASIDPELYYYYYSILTALVAKPMGNHSTVYDLHPLPVSQNDVENLTKKSLCIFFPKGFEIPRVRPALLSNESYHIENGSAVNVVTYMPTANISITYSVDYSNPLLVEGYAEAIISAFATEVVPCGHYHNEYECGNKTCIIDHSYYCTKYSISYTYSFKLLENSNIIDRYEYLGSLSVLADSDSSYDVAELEWGRYHGYGSFAKAWVRVREWGETSCSTSETNSTVYTACTTAYYADFSTETRSRGARFYKAVIPITIDRGEIWSGVLSTMSIAVDINGSKTELPIDTPRLLNLNLSAYPWESRQFNASIYLSDVASIAGSRILNFARAVKVASISMNISKPANNLDMYPWGSTVDVKPNVYVKTWSIRAPNISIAKIQRLLQPNPGELWLEKLILRYIHDKIKWFIVNNSAMNNYYDAYMWLLASQIPIGMDNCTPHSTTTPILDALCSKCGSEAERVKMLCNVTGYSLNASIKNVNLRWPSYNSTAINATVCMAKISSYPELWELYNETKNLVYALPEDSHYLVFYNIYEDSPFGDWRRVKQ